MERFLTLESFREIQSSHYLSEVPDDHKCSKIHGHRWRIGVKLQMSVANIPEDGMMMDFAVIKKIIDKMDHQSLNHFVPNPTCENLCIYLADEIRKEAPEGVELLGISVEESPGNVVRWS
jgi:6-pyruvoyltetrahydropterin/6-carboxytetrahydropterin synthase